MKRIKIYLEDNFTIIAIWIVLFLVIWIQVALQTKSILEATFFTISFLVLSFPFTQYLSQTLLSKAIRTKKFVLFAIQFIVFSIIDGLLFIILLYFFSFLEQQGIYPLSAYFNMDVPLLMLFIPISIGIVINICMCGLKFFQENTKLKRVLAEYQLRTLQHQITPHFMFNVLNHIHILMQTDVDLASDLLIKYSEILRYQLYNGDKQKVTIEQDIQFLKDFIAVEDIRWQGKLTVSCKWQINNKKLKIPPLLFIPFIENAFKYVAKSDFEKGYINIDFEEKNDTISFSIENSKSTLSTTNKQTGGLGLKNIKERLEILYYGKYKLSIEETDSVYSANLIITI